MPFSQFHNRQQIGSPLSKNESCRERLASADKVTGKPLWRILLSGALLVSCELAPPQAPRWEANLTIPLIQHRYSMRELIAQNKELYAAGDSLVHFLSQTQFDSIAVGERLSFAGFTRDFREHFSTLSSDTIQTRLTFAALYPPAANFSGQNVIIPAFPFSVTAVPLPAYKNFNWVELESGTLFLHLRNELPVALGPPLHLQLYDSSENGIIVDFTHNGEIPPGGELQQRFDLRSKKISRQLRLHLSGNSPGSNGRMVTASAASGLQVTVAVTDLKVRQARLQLGSQVLRGEQEVALGDSLHVVRADIKSGHLSLTVSSTFPVEAWAVATLPDFYTPQNTVRQDSLRIAPNRPASLNLNLAGHVFRPREAAVGNQKIRLQWRVRLAGASQQEVTLTNSDHVEGNFTSTTFVFSRVRGRFKAKAFALAPHRFALNLPTGLDSLQLAAAAMTVILRNSINFPLAIDFQVEGRNAQQLLVQGEVPPANNGVPTRSELLFTEQNSSLRQFLGNLPNTVVVRGQVLLSDPTYVGTVRESDFISGALRLDVPLAFRLPAQKVESDIAAVRIEPSLRQAMDERLQSGRLLTRVVNHLPLGGLLSLQLAARATEVFTKPLLVKSLTLPTPELDAVGRVTHASTKEVEIPLSAAELKVLQRTPLHAGALLSFPGSEGRMVRVMVRDYLVVQALAEVVTLMPEGGK